MDPKQGQQVKTGKDVEVITIKDSDESEGEDVVVSRRTKRIRTISSDDEDTLSSFDRSNPPPRSSISTSGVSGPLDSFVIVQGHASASNPNTSSVNQPVPSLDRSNSQPASSPQPHNRHGKLSSEINEQVAREALIDWLEEVEHQKRPKRDDEKRIQLEKAANWRQRRGKKADIEFSSNIPGSSVKGYFVMNSNGRSVGPKHLSSYYKSLMKSGNSTTVMNLNRAYSQPTHPLYEIMKNSSKDSQEKRPPLDIVYVSTLFSPEEKRGSLMETVMAIEPVQSRTVEEYPGSCCGEKKGQFSQRASHLTRKTNPSEIYKRTKGSATPMICVEKKVALMDSESTKELVEGFLMTYGDRFNKKHNCKRFIITDCAAPRMDDIIKAQKYLDDGTPMFRALKKGENPWPPPWATIEQATTLPWTVDETDLIVRFDPTKPTEKQHYKSFQNLEQLVAEFGDPPSSYFITMKESREEFKTQFEELKSKRL